MLYRMAFFHDRYPDPSEDTESIVDGVRTLRAAIKGFYHHGACRDWPDVTTEPAEGTWQSEGINPKAPNKALLFPSVAQAKKAREIVLGAYYRLSSILNHLHAALKDVGAILCSAKVHDGWLKATPQTGGIIAWPHQLGAQGAHAFVITGYDRHGFYVLNSWGENWGGYIGQVGIGLWPDADWAQNVIDAWVLCMGVSAPRAFGASIGEQGTKGVTGTVRAGSMPCLDLVGHYMHLADTRKTVIMDIEI